MCQLRKLGAGRIGKYKCVWKWEKVVKRRGGGCAHFGNWGKGMCVFIKELRRGKRCVVVRR